LLGRQNAQLIDFAVHEILLRLVCCGHNPILYRQ
jgi:hypothetical protein